MALHTFTLICVIRRSLQSKRSRYKDISRAFSCTINLDYVTLENKSIVVEQSIVGRYSYKLMYVHVVYAAQQHLSQQEIQRTDLSVQANSSSDNDTLKVATVVQQFKRELSEAVSEEDKIIFITKIVLNLIKQNDC
jgi:hypothetical protein